MITPWRILSKLESIESEIVKIKNQQDQLEKSLHEILLLIKPRPAAKILITLGKPIEK